MIQRHTPCYESIAVSITLFLLSIYHVFKRMAEGDILGIDDNAMQLSLNPDCSFPYQLANIQFTPVYTCTYELLSYVFAVPVLYFFVTVGLKFLTLFGLYRIYRYLASDYVGILSKSLLATCCVMFLIIGGAGRLQLNGDLILKSGIYTGMWAQMLLVYTLYYFISRRYLLAGLLIGLSIFLHPANTIHVCLVLFGATVLIERERGIIGAIALFGIPSLVALVIQYIAAYGMPFVTVPSLSGQVGLDTISDSSVLEKYSVSDWYQYILSQDPDDLSLVWNLSSRLGMFYLSFALVGFLIAARVEAKKTIGEFLSNPAIAICLMWYGYIAVCFLVEIFEFPEFALKQLIVIQPRRAFYLPVIFLSFYVTQYAIDFFTQHKSISLKSTTLFMLFVTWFLSCLMFTGNAANVRPITLILFLSLAVLLIFGRYYFSMASNHISGAEFVQLFRHPLLWTVGIVVVVILRFGTFTTTTTFGNLTTTFWDLGPRSYPSYLMLLANSRGEGLAKEQFFVMSEWIKNNISRSDSVLTAGLRESEIKELEVLNRRSFQSMNVYRYRGLMHFDKRRFDELIKYHTELSGLPVSSMGRTDGTIIDELEQTVLSFSEEDLCTRTTRDGKPFKYFLTTYDIDLDVPMVFERGPYTIYDLAKLRLVRKSCGS